VERRQLQFGRAAAAHVAERIRRADRIGVAWGSTLSRVVDGVARAGYPWVGEAIRQFVPVSGEPMLYAPSEYTASAIARRLDAIVNGPVARQAVDRDASQENERRLALTGVPAFIPADVHELLQELDDLTPDEHAVLARHFGRALQRFFEQSSPAYQRIFTQEEPLVDCLDMLLTSAGGSRRLMGFCNDELRKLGKITHEELERLIVGDLGGVLLPRHDASDGDLAKVRALGAMWTGITYQQLERIAQRAAQHHHTPGVVVVSIGAARSPVIREVLFRGLCTELIIDRDLAQALERELEGEQRRRTAGRRP
jgi:DNA-binding transcriptional regulator LsrR (DeoR family)